MSEVYFDMEKISKLSALKLEPEQSLSLKEDLEQVVAYVQKLQTLNIENINPFTHAHLEEEHAYREDTVQTPSFSPEEVIERSPEPIGGGFGVPKVVE